MNKDQFKRVAREGFRLTVTDRRLDEMWQQSERAIEAYKLKHPIEWAEAMEREAQSGNNG